MKREMDFAEGERLTDICLPIFIRKNICKRADNIHPYGWQLGLLYTR